ncbi:MAG: hypothetical protein M1837_007074 [Sclerophora amabilis]|nr:MAG: hypothetical protein M1837_007074 [Sclerophora amabilis]
MGLAWARLSKSVLLSKGQGQKGNSNPPLLWKFRSAKWFILTVVMMAVFTDIFLYGIIVPVIPFALTERVGVPQDQVQGWVSTLIAIYGAALLVGSPIFGWFADRSKSRRMPLLLGLLALGGATIMLCLGRTLPILIVARILQGLSAAVVWTVGLALLVDTVGKHEVGQSLGFVSLAMTLGTLVAPLVGGVVYDRAGYYPVFYMCFGMIAVDVVLRFVMIEKKIAAKWSITAEAASYGSLSAPAVAETHLGSPPDDRTKTESDQIAAIPGPPKIIKTRTEIEQQVPSEGAIALPKKRRRLPPVLILLKSRRLLSALWGCLVQASLMTSFDGVLPLFCKETFGWSSFGGGIIFLALFIPSFSAPIIGMGYALTTRPPHGPQAAPCCIDSLLCSFEAMCPVQGYLCDKYGGRYLATSGFLLGLPFYVLLRLVTHDTVQQIVLLCALLALIGVSLTLAMAPLMAEVTYIVMAKEKSESARASQDGRGSDGDDADGGFKHGAYAQAYGLFTSAFAGGTLIGPLWAGFIQSNAGWGTMTWTLGLLSGLTAIPTV